MAERRNPEPTDKQMEFFDELGTLLEKYNAELNAGDDGASYGMHSPLINLEFDKPYACFEFTSIWVGDCEAYARPEVN